MEAVQDMTAFGVSPAEDFCYSEAESLLTTAIQQVLEGLPGPLEVLSCMCWHTGSPAAAVFLLFQRKCQSEREHLSWEAAGVHIKQDLLLG